MKQKIITTIVFILLLSFVNAESLVIELNNENWELDKYYYVPEIRNQIGFTGGTLFEENILIKVTFNDESVIETNPTEFGLTIIEKPKEITKFEVYNQEVLLFEKSVSFCNNNNICEPCASEICDVSENAFLCNDCKDNEKDNACNPEAECDLDCRTYYSNYDLDKYKECFEENLELECEDHGLIKCEEGLYCDSETGDVSGKSCCTGSCVETPPNIIGDSCTDFDMNQCNENEFCTGEDLYYVPTNLTCCTGLCEPKEDKIETGLQETNEEGTSKTVQIIILVSVIIILILTFFFIRNKKIISVSFMFIILFSGILMTSLLEETPNQITSYATKTLFNSEKSRITGYYTAHEDDFEVWYNNELIGQSGIYYCQENERKFFPDLDYYKDRPLQPGEKPSFYAAVNCQGSGIAVFDGQERMCGYNHPASGQIGIQPTKEASGQYCTYDPEHSRGHTSSGANPTPMRTVACPPELKLGQEIYIDFGDNHDWTGCYVCEDRGGAITGNHFDVYKGVGRSELFAYNLPDYAYVYIGCGDELPRDDYYETYYTPSSTTSTTSSEEDVAEEISLENTLGFYYLNPSFKIEEEFDLKDIHEEIAGGPNLIRNVLECQDSGVSLSSCIDSNKKDNWLLSQSCIGNVCKFDIDTGQKFWVYTDEGYIEQSFILKIALTFNDSGIVDIPEWDDDIIEPVVEVDVEPGEQVGIEPGFVYGLDISHWSGEVSKEQMQCLWDSGVRHIIAGTQKPEITKQQLIMAIDQGMIVDIYSYIYYNDFSYTGRGNNILNSLPDDYRKKVGVHWIDIEETTAGYTYEHVMQKISQEVKTCQSQPNIDCGIYTAPGTWSGITGNTKKYSELPLWYAHWNEQKNFDSFNGNGNWWDGDFGGWTISDLAGHQYRGTHLVCDVNADANVFEAQFLAQRDSVKLI